MAFSKNAFKTEVKEETFAILDFWLNHAIDKENSGFYGTVLVDNTPKKSQKSVVATSRILWGFSTSLIFLKNSPELGPYDGIKPELEKLSKRAFQYLKTRFWDKTYGGVYWDVNPDGTKGTGTKSLYGHSFYVYGMSEYYRATQNKEALDMAQKCFAIIIEKAYDQVNGGYIEGFAENWEETNDYILAKGTSRKSMNTHLHLLECFANLYRVDKSKKVAFHLQHCLEIVLDKIIGNGNTHMTLFFTEDWQALTKTISYGHDIEASWLVLEAAEILANEELVHKCKNICLAMAKDAADGLQDDDGMIYEYDPETKHTNSSRDWWVMAEAMVGFYNAYQLSGKAHYLDKSERSWAFIKKYLIDHANGEWFGGVDAHHEVTNQTKSSPWKAPYHNLRACMEIYRRIS
ncbi:MAG: mannobiose 2-epimerase [Algoriphagus sp.]|jgi:mannobiose 2-epimerase